MKSFAQALAVLLLWIGGTEASMSTSAKGREAFLDNLVSKMTYEEMAAQLDLTRGEDFLIDGKLDDGVLEKLFGRIAPGGIHDFYPWNSELANAMQRYAVEKTRLKIPILLLEECLHGLSTDFKTIFPQAINLAATFDPSLAYKTGRGIAAETRPLGIHMCFNPVLDLAREPRWGRVEEGYGEDPFLGSRMAVGMVKGMQGDTLNSNYSVVATIKHFAGHGVPEGGRNCATAKIGYRDVREAHLKPFEAAVKEANARGLMASYNEIDGIAVAGDPVLLTDILRKEWGFSGMVISDLGAIHNLESFHRVAVDSADAIRKGITAGINMQFYDYSHYTYNRSIVEGIHDKTLSLSIVKERVKEILRLKWDLGLFANPYVPRGLAEAVDESNENAQLALEVARRSIVLLKNDNSFLPLSPSKMKPAEAVKDRKPRIALIGPSADTTRTGDYSGGGKAQRIVSLREALDKVLGEDVDITYRPAIHITNDRTEFIAIRPSYLLDTNAQPGLLGEYFAEPEFRSAAFTRLDANINFNWYLYAPHTLGGNARALPQKNYAVRWTGYIRNPFRDLEATANGTVKAIVRFAVNGNDEAFVYFNANPTPVRENQIYELTFDSPDAVVAVKIEYINKGGDKATFAWSLQPTDSEQGIVEAVNVARMADVVILVMGENDYTVGEAQDRQSLSLPGRQHELIQRVSSVNPNTVLVLYNGRPLTITAEQANANIPAIVNAFFPGESGGQAIAEILLGIVNPSGKLPFSYPTSLGVIPIYYNRKSSSLGGYSDIGSNTVLYPFGHGLSYSRFSYFGLNLPSQVSKTGIVSIHFSVSRTAGMPDAEEVAQVYIRDVVSSVSTPTLMLKGMQRLRFTPQVNTQTVNIDIDVHKELGLYDRNMDYVVEPGTFQVFVGRSSAEILLSGTFEVI